MAELKMTPPTRSPYVAAGMIAVSAIVVALLAVFVVTRFTRPAAPLAATAVPAPTAKGVGAAAAKDTSITGQSRPDDLVMARQLLMDGNDTAMGPIDRAAAGQDVPLASLKENAYAIYTYLAVAPHLFPAATRPVASADGSPPSTAATAAIWDDFEAFYAAAMGAANDAFEGSQAADMAKFRAVAVKLRTDCDTCHDKYMHAFDPATGK